MMPLAASLLVSLLAGPPAVYFEEAPGYGVLSSRPVLLVVVASTGETVAVIVNPRAPWDDRAAGPRLYLVRPKGTGMDLVDEILVRYKEWRKLRGLDLRPVP